MLPVRVFRNCVNDLCSAPSSTWSRLPRLFDDLFDETLFHAGSTLPVDVRQEGNKWVIEAEVPGIARENLNITVENGVLTISGKYAQEAKKENAEYYVRERRTGEFSRSFRLPETADSENVTAQLANGVLTLTIPTREDAKPRRIELK
ncbi:MAG: Hsp20/alpha crystallin family protein [Phycisphaerae bacterium]